MADIRIGTMDTTIEFEPDAPAAPAPALAPAPMGAPGAGDALQLRELMRPLVVELLEEELARYLRMRG